MDLMKALTSQYMKKELPEMNVGDTVRVHVKIKEGSRERRSRPFAAARSAVRSSTTSATASARPPRSRRRSEFIRKNLFRVSGRGFLYRFRICR